MSVCRLVQQGFASMFQDRKKGYTRVRELKETRPKSIHSGWGLKESLPVDDLSTI